MKRTWMPTAAGMLMLVSAVLALLTAAAMPLMLFGATARNPAVEGFASYTLYSFGSSMKLTPSLTALIWVGLTLAIAVPGLVSLIGGVCALGRQRWGLAVTGSILSLFAPLPIGLPAVVLLLLAKREFEGQVAAS